MQLYTRICKQCGQEFKTYSENKVFCNRKCSYDYRIAHPPKEICRFCKKEFFKTINASVYCSPECRIAANQKKLQDERKKYRQNQTCQFCGKKFSHDVKKKYCSAECRIKAGNLMRATKGKKKKSTISLSLNEVARLARKENLSYGQYVQKYGL